ncbi:MAG: F0F1 ATP synthase subunit delta [Patescibacteria group bacterium]|jgi:F-type H+-transporting ATPase subunit delta
MKIKINDYAKALIESAETKDGSHKEVAIRFWRLLQRNKQHRDLHKILSALDQEYGKKHNLLIGKVFSAKPLSADELKTIQQKVAKRLGKEVELTPVLDKRVVTGISVRVGDIEIDATAIGKIERLKQKLINN